ncbi:MAG: ABC transporter permease [Myxococcales bacterium]|nr:ABC transporter permease [Myxococcales bacterium]
MRSAAIGRILLLRLLGFAGTTLVAATLVVLLFAAAPGDAIDTLPNGEEVRAVLEAEWGLGGSFSSRVGSGLLRLAQGDFGESLTFRPGVPVIDLVTTGAAASAWLLFPAAVLSLGLAFARPAAGAGLRALSAVPMILASLGVVHGVNAAAWTLIHRGWIERPTWFALPEEAGRVRTTLAILLLGFASAHFAQLVRRASVEVHRLKTAAFVEAERARGGSVRWMMLRHLLVPAARIGADTLPALFSGLIVVERAFNLPGAGTTFWNSCADRDWPLASALALAFAVSVALARLAADSLAILLDPRAREATA